MYPAQGLNFKIGRGGLYLADWDGSTPPGANLVGDEVGNCENITAGPVDPQSLQIYSSTQNNSPLVTDTMLRVGWQVTAQCHEHTLKNLLRFFAATQGSTQQASDTADVVNLTDVQPGQTYNLGAVEVSNVSVMLGTIELTAGTDYVLYARTGFIKILEGGQVQANDDLEVTFDQAAVDFTDLRVGQQLSRTCKVTFVADDSNNEGVAAGDVAVFWKAAVVLQGEYNFISGDEAATFPLQFNILSDEQNHPNDPLGYIRRASAA